MIFIVCEYVVVRIYVAQVPFATEFLFTRLEALAVLSIGRNFRTNIYTNILLRSIPVVLDATFPNIVCFPRSLEASRREDHISEVIHMSTFVCTSKNLSD